jgi:8-oxo-dGTP pyrophosphatase MutT (NUDIX family)
MPKESSRHNDPAPWSVERREYIYRSPWLTVRKERVRLSNDAVMDDYYVLEYTDWVNAVLVTTKRELVLIRIYRHGLGEVHYELPGGCVDAGESPLHAARRESLEETGYGAESWTSLGVCCANPATHNNRTYLFLADNASLKQAPQQEDTEEIVTVLVPLSELSGILDRGEVISASHALALTQICRRYDL